MSLRKDVAADFQTKGLKFISLNESSTSPGKSTLVYQDSAGKMLSKEINLRISELEDTLSALDAMDPEGLADYLLS